MPCHAIPRPKPSLMGKKRKNGRRKRPTSCQTTQACHRPRHRQRAATTSTPLGTHLEAIPQPLLHQRVDALLPELGQQAHDDELNQPKHQVLVQVRVAQHIQQPLDLPSLDHVVRLGLVATTASTLLACGGNRRRRRRISSSRRGRRRRRRRSMSTSRGRRAARRRRWSGPGPGPAEQARPHRRRRRRQHGLRSPAFDGELLLGRRRHARRSRGVVGEKGSAQRAQQGRQQRWVEQVRAKVVGKQSVHKKRSLVSSERKKIKKGIMLHGWAEGMCRSEDGVSGKIW
ncbi:hypothetical protein BC567DRAFT_15298 [Phyllosticta citribraziliensis]